MSNLPKLMKKNMPRKSSRKNQWAKAPNTKVMKKVK